MQLRTLCLLAGLCISSSGFADAKRFYVERASLRESPKAKALQDNWYVQKIDHLDAADQRTFKQRFYVDSSLASGKDAPVFFYICGESTCESRSITSGFIRKLAATYHGHLVALEHRYYGLSQPFETLAVENLRYLSTPQAVEDLASFQKAFTDEQQWTGKWVAIGGSYPGSLSAYYRNKHPELVVGALASSAPVKAKEDFSAYDEHVTKVAGEACAAKMRVVVNYAESVLDDEAGLAKLKAAFAASDVREPLDFIYLIADIGAFAVQYGMRDQFCDALVSSRDPVVAYGNFAKSVFSRYGFSALSLTAQSAESLNPLDYIEAFGMRQWFYQSCTEYGYWQNASADPARSVRSSKIDLAYHRGLCKRLFNIETPVDTSKINDVFFKPLLDASSSAMVFTNGEQDPWSNLSLSNADTFASDIKLLVIAGGAHCDDLRDARASDSPSLKAARRGFEADLARWLNSL